MDNVAQALGPLIERDPALRFRYDGERGVIAYLRGDLDRIEAPRIESIQDAGLEFIARNKELFGTDAVKARIAVASDDPHGGQTVVLQQLHGPLTVYGGSVRFHVSSDGVLDTVENRLFPDLADVPLEPKIAEEDAVRAATEATHTDVPPAEPPVLMVYRHEGKPRLVWEIKLNDDTLGDDDLPRRMIAYVDAIDGEVLLNFNNVQTAGPIVANGTGVYSGAGTVNAWFNDVTNQLRDTTRTGAGGPEIRTNDEDGASPSEDADANWNDLTAVPRDQSQGAEVDAHRYAGNVVDYYRTVHGRNSWNGTGGNLITVVHLGTNYNNGYWDGAKVNLGDGDNARWNYCTTDDWLAHEFTHGYTQSTCALQYLNESGALNEAFSDVMAAFITGDWLVFEDNWLPATAPAARNMIDPTNGGSWNPADPINSTLAGHQPSHYSVRYTGLWDNGGVHVNSGIINNLFYLLSVGGMHTVSGIAVSGIGNAAAEQMLWRCMSVNLVGNPTATFIDFREAMLDACLDLFPTDLLKLTQVKNAFNAVGIGPDLYVRDNLADTGQEPFGGTYLWASPDIINRQAASANPAADFADLTNDALWQNVEFGQQNFVYVRVQNRGPAAGDVNVRVYFSSATTFGTPASWIYIGAAPAVGITPGGMQIVGPINFPAAQIPAVGHYCMIAVVSDAADPAPDHTLIASVGDYLDYVRNTNNISYRNMDVVNLVPGTPGFFEAMIRGLAGRERFEIRIDIGRFLPIRDLRVIGPAWALAGAEPRGLRLVEKTEKDLVFSVDRRRRFRENFGPDGHSFELGFDQLLVDGEFPIRIEFEVEEDPRALRMARRSPFEIHVRQLWKGEIVGGVGLRLVPAKIREVHDHRREKAPDERIPIG